MKAFEIKTSRSNYPFLVIADGFKTVVEILHQKGIYDTDIISVQQLESYKSDHILHEWQMTEKDKIVKEVTKEVQKTLPKWLPEPDGGGGGADIPIYLIRASKGHYYTANSIGGNGHYLVLDTLEQLPGLPKED